MTFGWLIGVALVGAALYALRVAASEWRGTDGVDPFRAPEWWPFDMPAWRALIRAGPVGAVEGTLFGARYLASLLEDSPVAEAAQAVLTALMLVALALMVLIGLYNRPSRAVAPRFRAFPGAIDEWNGARPPAGRPTSRDGARRR